MPWYVYAMWVYPQERGSQHDLDLEPYLDIPFAPAYTARRGYVQRLSLALRVPQPEGMSMPTAQQDPNTNAMYKTLLFRGDFHAQVIDEKTGKTIGWEKLHCSESGEGEKNPFSAFMHQEAALQTRHRAQCRGGA